MFAPTHETKPASRFVRSVSIASHPLSRDDRDYNGKAQFMHAVRQ